MSISRRAVLTVLTTSVVAGCSGPAKTRDPSGSVRRAGGGDSGRVPGTPSPTPTHVTRAQIVTRYGHLKPHTWGFGAPGVLRRLPAGRREIVLTFDACGGPGGNGYDHVLIDFLLRRKIPATLFLNSRWIDANPKAFRLLLREPLFEIANHGTRHRPLSVTGRSAYGIAGTRDAGEVYDEVVGNHAKLTRFLGSPPRFFRSGTAYCDDIAERIVRELGERVVTFSVNGDGGATFTHQEVGRTVAAAPSGSIVIGHMNQPRGGTAQGIAAAVPELLAAGHRFVRLSDGIR